MRTKNRTEDDIAICIQEYRRRLREHVESPREFRFRIKQRRKRVSAIIPVALYGRQWFLKVHTDHGDFRMLSRHVLKERQFLFAEDAPRRPEVHDGGLAPNLRFQRRRGAIEERDAAHGSCGSTRGKREEADHQEQTFHKKENTIGFFGQVLHAYAPPAAPRGSPRR